jgi:hypothetical protein
MSRKKYNNRPCICNQGHKHDSRGEAVYCDNLALLKRAGEIKDYEIQKRFPLLVDGKKVCTHIADFLVTGKDGVACVHEYKGMVTQTWRIKHKLFLACYPNVPYKVIYHNKGY